MGILAMTQTVTTLIMSQEQQTVTAGKKQA